MVTKSVTEEVLMLLREKELSEVGKYEWVKLLLEALASIADDDIMESLLIEVMQANTELTRQLEQKVAELERLSMTDQLTGLFNRRQFLTAMADEIERGERYGRAFSLIMFDVDHFKQVNDQYGHEVGDKVLQSMASLVNRRIRKMDIACRWGGEEFMILLPETTDADAFVVAEELRRAMEKHDFEIGERVTSSFGVVQWASGTSGERVTQRVDEALYMSKKNGRNRVTVVGVL